ncbi:hypothetical protein SCHPADRAFT_895876, partial [Schizopora paradoxa]
MGHRKPNSTNGHATLVSQASVSNSRASEAEDGFLDLPVLGQTLDLQDSIEEGVDATHLIKTTRLELNGKDATNKTLKEILKGYGLPFSGNRTEKIDRLRKFSADKSAWMVIFNTNELKRKRGSTSGSRAESTFAKRKRTMFGEDPKLISLSTKNKDERIGMLPKAEWVMKVNNFLLKNSIFRSMVMTSLIASPQGGAVDYHKTNDGGRVYDSDPLHSLDETKQDELRVVWTPQGASTIMSKLKQVASTEFFGGNSSMPAYSELEGESGTEIPSQSPPVASSGQSALIQRYIRQQDKKMDVIASKLDDVARSLQTQSISSIGNRQLEIWPTHAPSSSPLAMSLPIDSPSNEAIAVMPFTPSNSLANKLNALTTSSLEPSPTRVSPSSQTFVLPQVPVQVQQDAGNSTASAATAPVQRITIQMGDNEFTFDPMSVPDVPNVNYSQKIDELFVDWDSELRASL